MNHKTNSHGGRPKGGQDDEQTKNTFFRHAIRKGKECYKEIKQYLSNPKQFIEVLTLFFVAAYTVTTLFLLLNTIGANRAQNKASKISQQIARDTEKRELRAYLYVDAATKFNSSSTPVTIIPTVNMRGQTAAYKLHAVVKSLATPSLPPDNSPEMRNQPVQRKEFRKASLFGTPGWTLEYVNPSLTGSLVIPGSELKIFVWRSVEYDDSFKCHHLINWCVVMADVAGKSIDCDDPERTSYRDDPCP